MPADDGGSDDDNDSDHDEGVALRQIDIENKYSFSTKIIISLCKPVSGSFRTYTNRMWSIIIEPFRAFRKGIAKALWDPIAFICP
jgi:hypothetical protein